MASILILFGTLLCFFVHLQIASFSFNCPGPIDPPQGYSYARIESNISGRAEEVYEKIRIKLFHDPTIEDKPYKGLVKEAADFWSNVLSVKPVNGRLFFSRDCESQNEYIYGALDGSGEKDKYCLGSCNETTQCIEIEVRKEHLDGCLSCTLDGKNCTKDQPEPGNGVDNADTVFYVSAIDTKNCKGPTVAYAGFCDIEPVLDRPVFALINICPTAAASYDKKEMLKTIKHEMMHALGFGGRPFSYFRDKEGKPLWPRNDNGEPMTNQTGFENQKVWKFIDREWHVRGEVIQRKLRFLITPNVLREAQAHFNCSELEGAEIEDHANGGMHLEARVFYDDGMRSSMDGKGLFTRLDFAVLEDSGWYQVNYSQAEDMDFGRNLGCDFCMKSCKFWIDNNSKEGKETDPYCDSPDLEKRRGITCNGPKKLFSGCPLGKIPLQILIEMRDPNTHPLLAFNVPRQYQHFDKISGVDDNEVQHFGSIDGFADYCPVPFQNVDVTGIVGADFDCEKETIPTKKPVEPSPTRKPWDPWDPIPTRKPWDPWEPIPTRKPVEPIPTWTPWDPFSTWTPWDPFPTRKRGNPIPTRKPFPTRKPWDRNPTRKPWVPIPPFEPKTSSKKWDPIPTRKRWKPYPEEDDTDYEYESDKSAHLGSPILLVFLLPLLVIIF